jgi:branched-chain amino acid transport system substrate-binding protein
VAGIVIIATAGVLSGCGGSEPVVRSAAQACGEDPFGCVRVGPDEPVQIGALLWDDPTVGGRDSFRGVELAVDGFDRSFDGEGALLGHEVEVVEVDEGCTASGGRKGARRLLTGGEVVGIVGTSCSASSYRAAAEAASNAGTVIVSPSNTLAELTEPGKRAPFFFRTSANDLLQSRFVANFIDERHPEANVLMVDTDDIYSSSLGSRFVEAWAELEPEVPVRRVTVPSAASASAIEEKLPGAMGGEGPSVAYFPALGGSCLTALDAIVKTLRPVPDMLITSDGCISTAVLDQVKELGVTVFITLLDSDDRFDRKEYTEEFLPAYRKRFGSDPTSTYHAEAYDAAELILAAVEKVAIEEDDGSLAIPRSEIRDAIEALAPWDGLSGPIDCGSEGDCRETATYSAFKSPDWPVAEGAGSAKPVFSETLEMSRK